jgi:hypothetical protein
MLCRDERVRPMHSEERRIAGLLRELILESGATLEKVEDHLHWEPGRLSAVLDGDERLAFDDLFELLPELGATPADFFAWLYGFETREGQGVGHGAKQDDLPPVASRSLDQRFDKSLRVVRNAMERRRAWKAERGEE